MLLSRKADGTLAPFDDTDTLEKPCYDYKGLARSATFLERAHGRAARRRHRRLPDRPRGRERPVRGQLHLRAMRSRQRRQLRVLQDGGHRDRARRMGMIATFMPKPFSNRTGTGAHFHISIGDAKTRTCSTTSSDKQGLGLSQHGLPLPRRAFSHTRARSRRCARRSINSYKRLVVGRALSGATWAPAYIAYGDNNRTACVRVPDGRLELRLPDGSCNPYLATAGDPGGGPRRHGPQARPGRADQREPLRAGRRSSSRSAGIKLLPQNLNEAIDAFERTR